MSVFRTNFHANITEILIPLTHEASRLNIGGAYGRRMGFVDISQLSDVDPGLFHVREGRPV